MEELKNLPLDVTVTFLVAEDSEFLTGQVIEYALPEGAVNGYRMIASVTKNTVPAIGFKLHRVRDEEYKDVQHYFFTKDEEGPDFSVEGVGFEYKEVRELVEKVFALAKEQGLWNGKTEPPARTLIHDYTRSEDDWDVLSPDHKLTNNFNPNAEYSNLEYVNVHFHLLSKYYCGEGWGDRVCDRIRFDEDVRSFFKRAGWDIRNGAFSGSCEEAWRGEGGTSEYLYLHPNDFSGVIRKSTVGELVGYLENSSFGGARHDSFALDYVSIHKNLVYMDDEEFRRHFDLVRDDMMHCLLDGFRTKRYDTFVWEEDVIRMVARKYSPNRVNSRAKATSREDSARTWVVDNYNEFDPYALEFVKGVEKELEDAGWLIRSSRGNSLRRVNASEQKARHLRESDFYTYGKGAVMA